MALRRNLLIGAIAGTSLGLGAIAIAAPAATPPAAQPAAGPVRNIDARPWPREYEVDGVAFSIYRPQIDAWTGNKLSARSVMAVKTGETKDAAGKTVVQQAYGVVWLTARTETDRLARELVLDKVAIEKVAFPSAPEKEAAYLALARKVSPTTELVVSLNQVEAALALTQAGVGAAASQPIDTDPPEIIFAFQPSVLLLVDGQPVFRPSTIPGVERVINTKAALFRHYGSFYANLGGKWSSAASLDGPWVALAKPPPPVLQAAVAAQKPAAKPPAGAAPAKTGTPQVIARTKRAELIVVEGQPTFADIAGTSLKFVSNTPADVLIDASGAWYVVIAGRWFTGPSSKGPWRYVDPKTLPEDFAKIPGDSPKSAVLASIPGTPEAKEALVANAVPQTATVNRKEAKFEAKYDGPPQYRALETTTLTYAANAQVPIFRVGAGAYYAIENAVWFTADGPNGPWTAATSVPDEIYKIPSWSALHYVTYAYVYGSSGDEIYVGYTPGYYGTVVNKGVVVYGTGYPCNSWVGQTWYGCPTPYGQGAAFAYGATVGWTLTFGYGWYDPWYDPWWGPWGYYGYGYGYYPGGYYPYYGGAAVGNVYGRWGNSVVAGTAAAWANPYTGNYGRAGAGGYTNTVTGGRGYGYAGRNTNIYTGTSTAAAGGVRYNPQTGRVVSGQGGSISNIYTGAGVAGGTRTVTNTNTGRTTEMGGVAGRGQQGAGAVGGFRTDGANGSAAGAGYIKYDRDTGDVSRGGVADINGDIYAGKDGNVYKRNDDGTWSQAGRDGQFSRQDRSNASLNEAALNSERLSRDRGYQRDRESGGGFERSGASRPSFDRGSYGGASRGSMGGMRGGGMRGGGGRRR